MIQSKRLNKQMSDVLIQKKMETVATQRNMETTKFDNLVRLDAQSEILARLSSMLLKT